jgi:pimeloyl-ACP methyl ester carboxylesterase
MYVAAQAPVRPAITRPPFPRMEKGDGEVVVFLHGIFGSPENWREQTDGLADGYRVVVPLLPIFEVPLDDCTVQRFTEHVREYLDWAGIDRATFVGNSFGGHVALDLAIRFPERTRALVLAGSSGLFERGYEKGVPVHPSREWIEDRIAAQVFHDASQIRPEMVDEVVEVLASSASKRRLVRIAKSAKRTHMGGKLHRITAPTLLVWGKQDRITPLEVAREFRDGIPDAELVLIDECGHAPMIEQPARFTRALRSFLDSLNNGRAA